MKQSNRVQRGNSKKSPQTQGKIQRFEPSHEVLIQHALAPLAGRNEPTSARSVMVRMLSQLMKTNPKDRAVLLESLIDHALASLPEHAPQRVKVLRAIFFIITRRHHHWRIVKEKLNAANQLSLAATEDGLKVVTPWEQATQAMESLSEMVTTGEGLFHIVGSAIGESAISYKFLQIDRAKAESLAFLTQDIALQLSSRFNNAWKCIMALQPAV